MVIDDKAAYFLNEFEKQLSKHFKNDRSISAALSNVFNDNHIKSQLEVTVGVKSSTASGGFSIEGKPVDMGDINTISYDFGDNRKYEFFPGSVNFLFSADVKYIGGEK